MGTQAGSTEAEVRELEERRYRAMLAADIATLDRLLDDALTYTHSSGVIDTKASYLAGIRDKVWEYKNITRENERLVVRGNAALVFCRLRIDLLVRGTPEGREQRTGGVGEMGDTAGCSRCTLPGRRLRHRQTATRAYRGSAGCLKIRRARELVRRRQPAFVLCRLALVLRCRGEACSGGWLEMAADRRGFGHPG